MTSRLREMCFDNFISTAQLIITWYDNFHQNLFDIAVWRLRLTNESDIKDCYLRLYVLWGKNHNDWF